jgi:hypothetical protein
LTLATIREHNVTIDTASTAALVAFDHRDYVNNLGRPAHAHTPDDLDHALMSVVGDPRPGTAYASFSITATKPHHQLTSWHHRWVTPTEAHRRDPYRQLAALLHVIYIRSRPRLRHRHDDSPT